NVKTTCGQFIDYLLIGKINGEWKIINVLWEMKKRDKNN
ncbi:MAG: nuclear transport factor 2 family protein, partial [Calditrichia bacterium]|nr:nuclear transport factor 2 family protein [Calditrichia bacterium]